MVIGRPMGFWEVWFGLEPSVVLSYPLLGVERHVTSPYGERVSPISGRRAFMTLSIFALPTAPT